MGTKQYTDQLNKELKELYSWCLTRELKHATFLSHGRQPEVNISHARTVVSLTFSNLSYLLVRLNNINVAVWREVEYENNALSVAVRGSKTLHAQAP